MYTQFLHLTPAYRLTFMAQPTYVRKFLWLNQLMYNFLSAAYINFKRPFITKLTHLCTEFQKLDPPMYAHFGFQNPPWLDHHDIQVFIGVPFPPGTVAKIGTIFGLISKYQISGSKLPKLKNWFTR